MYRSCPLFLQIIVFLIISLIKINGPCVALKDNTCFVVLFAEELLTLEGNIPYYVPVYSCEIQLVQLEHILVLREANLK